MTTKVDLENKLRQLEDTFKNQPSYNPQEHKDKTRSQIALFVVRAYFFLIGGVLFLLPIYNHLVRPEIVISVKDLLGVLSGVISGPFGFVVGYYFKGTEKE